MSTPEQPSTAGWFDDPDDPGQLRYFDGVLWTRHVTPRQTRVAMPQEGDLGWAPPAAMTPVQNPYAGQERPPAGGFGPAPAYTQGWATAHGPTGPHGAPLAAWWQRLLGWLIDSFVTSALVAVVGWTWLAPIVSLYSDFVRRTLDAAAAGTTPPPAESFMTEIAAYLVPLSLVSLGVGLVYTTALLVWRGQTVGKMVMGTKVVRLDGQAGIPLVTALRRQVIQVVASALGLGPSAIGAMGSVLALADDLWLLWDPRRQCLHDKVAQTVVVRTR